MFRTIVLLMLLLSLFQSCSSEEIDCFQPVNITGKATFMARYMIQMDTITIDSIEIDTTYIIYRDSMMEAPYLESIDFDRNIHVFGGRGATTVLFPFNPDTDSIRYSIQFDTAVAAYDTLTLYYKPQVNFISNNCGFTNYYYIDSIRFTYNYLDSVAINVREVTNDATKRHILFYFF